MLQKIHLKNKLALKKKRCFLQFYKKTVKRYRDIEKYDTYRTYKRKNIKNIKELYFDVSKLKNKLGFKKFNPTNENI
mgnify:CR=1 FL=1